MSGEDDTSLSVRLPPLLPDINEVLESYLDSPESLPMHNNEPLRFWDRVPQPKRLLFADIAPLSTTPVVDRDPATRKSIGF